MAWFIIQCESKTWTKYLVEAESEDAVLGASDDWQYLGYMGGEDTDSKVIGGPFEDKPAAMADLVSYVDG